MARRETLLLFPLLTLLIFTLACSSDKAIPQKILPGDSIFKNPSIVQKDFTSALIINNQTRTYYVHIPQSYTGKREVPLLLVFHGSGADGKTIAQQSHFNGIAENAGFIVVYPDGYQQQWADGRGTTPPEQAGVDDVGFISTLIDRLTSELNIDPDRIYAAGMSNGGIFAQRLGCELSYKIAAIASVAATMAENIFMECQPSRPVPVLIFMGTADQSVPFNGGQVDQNQGEDISADATVQFWVTQNGCASSPTAQKEPFTVNNGLTVFQTQYSQCQQNADVILYTIEGGEHAWPGATISSQDMPEPYPNTSGDTMDASQIIWKYFQEHPW